MEKKCIGVEMESFALFHNAKRLNKKAATLLTVSDNFETVPNLFLPVSFPDSLFALYSNELSAW